jgi:phytoene synthase
LDRALLQTLPPVARLALAYAPARAQPAWLAVLALDARLAQQVRSAREPILGQIKLAWWRERLAEPPAAWPQGEPLLMAVAGWHGHHPALAALVDGWEALLGGAPLPDAVLAQFVAGRAAAMQGLARVLHRPEAAAASGEAGAGWAIADLAAHLTDADERAAAGKLADAHDWRRPRLPRDMRPLVVLRGLGQRHLDGGGRATGSAGQLLLAMRLGIFGI